GMATGLQPVRPRLAPGVGIEGPEARVARAGDEDESAHGGDGAAQAGRSRGRQAARDERVHHAERNRPGDLSLVEVDGVERSPGRLLARPAVLVPEAR